MYWNISSAIAFIFRDMININMRCIEMMKATLKALKEFKININMRCIEILDIFREPGEYKWININMRCIEIEHLMFWAYLLKD